MMLMLMLMLMSIITHSGSSSVHPLPTSCTNRVHSPTFASTLAAPPLTVTLPYIPYLHSLPPPPLPPKHVWISILSIPRRHGAQREQRDEITTASTPRELPACRPTTSRARGAVRAPQRDATRTGTGICTRRERGAGWGDSLQELISVPWEDEGWL